MTKNPALFYGAIVVAIVGILLGVYYLIPGVYHPLTFSGRIGSRRGTGNSALFPLPSPEPRV